jgi:FKBP-type peptidyl-prolyl cis-trans isomerase 2
MDLEKHAKVGDIVTIHFTGKLEDGSIFDSTEKDNPLKFKIGNNEVIQGIDEAVVGMKINQEKSIHISSDKAYGSVEKELIINVKKTDLPNNLKVKINQELKIPYEEGDYLNVRITKISTEIIEFDGNHPLAGKNLLFDLKLIEIV